MGLESLDPPDQLLWQFNIFCELSKRRGITVNGPAPISYADIGFYSQLKGMSLDVWEVDLITTLDDVWLKDHYGRSSKTSDSS